MKTPKKSLVMMGVIFLTVFFIFAGLSNAEEAKQKVYKVKLSSYLPKANYESTEVPWAKAIEKASNGQIKFEMYPYEQLVKAKGHLDAIRTGQVDCGRISTPYYVGRFPMAELYFLPFVWKTGMQGAQVLQEFVNFPPVREEFHKQGVIPLLMGGTGTYVLATTKPVKKLEDLKGMKLRSFGTMLPEVQKRLGAIPTSMPTPETFTALQTGTLDGSPFWLSGIASGKMYDVAPYVTVFPHGGITHAVWPIVWGEKSWNKLPKHLQDIILKVSNEKSWISEGFDIPDEQMTPEVKKNVKLWYELPPEEAKRFAEKMEGICEWWVEENKDKGPAQEVMDHFLMLLGKHGMKWPNY